MKIVKSQGKKHSKNSAFKTLFLLFSTLLVLAVEGDLTENRTPITGMRSLCPNR